MWGRCPEAGVRAGTGRPGGGAAGCALPSAAGGPALPQGPCVCGVRMLMGVARTSQSQEACFGLCVTQPPPQQGPFPKLRTLSLSP